MNKKQELEYYFHRYPEISPILIIKLSVTKYGTVFTDRALARLQEKDYRFTKAEPFGISLEIRKQDFYTPGAVVFRDGSSVLVNYGEPYRTPYVVDYDPQSGAFLLTEDGAVIDTVDFLARPAFFDGTTSAGTSMDLVGGTCTVQRLLINGFQRCRFWEGGEQCHYCALFSADSVLEGEVSLADIRDTFREAVREPGRFTEVSVSGGSDFGGDPPFSDEIARYIRVLHALEDGAGKKIESQLMAPAYRKEDLRRIYEDTMLTSYRPNIEVWDETSFRRMCPGKERWIGRDEWIRRMVGAVDVFGPGRVYTQMVCGAELAEPSDFTSVDAAVESAVAGCEFFAENGISCHEEVWRPHRREKLGWQEMQELDYFIRIAKEFHEIHLAKGICAVETNYMRGSDNPDADLERADYAAKYPVTNRFSEAVARQQEYEAAEAPEEIRALVRDPRTEIRLQTGDGEAFAIDRLYLLEPGALMIPLRTDKSTLSSYLVKHLWFKDPVDLWLQSGREIFHARCLVYRHHLVGTRFRRCLDLARAEDPAADPLAAEELHLLSCEKAIEMPQWKLLPHGEVFAHGHLDRSI